MVPFLFHGRELWLSPCGALWWPAESALLLADLHLGKARFFAATGQFLPPYDSFETALRICELIRQTEARHVLCLGDSFHDADGAAHLEARALALLRQCADGRRWTWVTGNHDQAAAPPFGEVTGDMCVDRIWLRHEAIPGHSEPEISGHFHPKVQLHHRGRSIRRRCFLASETKLVLPAFGALTGGLDVRHPAFHDALGAEFHALVPTGDRLLRWPVRAMAEPTRDTVGTRYAVARRVT